MKLVIDVPDETYTAIKNMTRIISGGRGIARKIEYDAFDAIYNGKPLEQKPKTDTWSIKDVADTLAKYGLIAEQEPKTGHWIIETWNNKEHYSCSSCQHVVDYEPCYHYCPYCGAKMIEPQESEE